MKYIMALFLIGVGLLFLSPFWGVLWLVWVGGLSLGLIVCFELIAYGLARSEDDPKWREIMRGFNNEVERKRKRR